MPCKLGGFVRRSSQHLNPKEKLFRWSRSLITPCGIMMIHERAFLVCQRKAGSFWALLATPSRLMLSSHTFWFSPPLTCHNLLPVLACLRGTVEPLLLRDLISCQSPSPLVPFYQSSFLLLITSGPLRGGYSRGTPERLVQECDIKE